MNTPHTPKTIAVTGGTGFLGNVVIQKLLQQDYIIRSLQYTNKTVLPHHKKLQVIQGDIRNLHDVHTLCEGADVVIHAASYISIVSHQKKKLEDINVGGTKNILAVCKTLNIKTLVYVSSVEAIGKVHEDIHTEDDGFNPDAALIPYGSSKARASNQVLEFATQFGTEHHCKVITLCPSGIVGPFDNGTSDIGNMIKKYIKKKLHAYPSRGGFCFVDVRDVADAVIRGMHTKKNGEWYIISSEYIDCNTMMNLLEEISNIPKPKLKIPLWILYIVGIYLEFWAHIFKQNATITTGSIRILKSKLQVSSEKIQKELGIIPRPIQESFFDQIKWYRGLSPSFD